jgi:hypothetical protein
VKAAKSDLTALPDPIENREVYTEKPQKANPRNPKTVAYETLKEVGTQLLTAVRRKK